MTDVIVSSKDVVVEVQQPIIPPAAPPPKIGLVEINQVVQRGSAWVTGHGPPQMAGGQFGDMYLDMDTGDVYLWMGAEWEYQGTFAPSTLTPEEILAALLTVDGDGCGLDADLLDGHHAPYFATQTDMTATQAKDAAQDTAIATNVTNIDDNAADIADLSGRVTNTEAGQTPAAILTKLLTVDGPGSGLDADTLDGHDTSYFATQTALATETTNRTAADTAEITARSNADTALDGKITTEKNRNDAQDTTIATKIGDAPNDGGQYVRKNLAWALVSVPPGTIVSDTAPASPAANQMWLKSDTGVLYIFYADPNSSQWIQVSASPQIVDQNYSRKTARAKNRVINPTAQVTQENGVAVMTASGSYIADQWRILFNIIVGAGQRVTLPTPSPEGSTTGVAVWASTAKPSLVATDALYVQQPIEGMDVSDLGWGTAQAKQAVLRFCALADTAGTYAFCIHNATPPTRSYLGSFTVATAGVPQVFSAVIPGDTTGTWAKDNTLGLLVEFAHTMGSSYVGVPGWQAGAFYSVPGCINGAAVANAKLTITDVGLYADPENTGIAPPFVAPSYEDDLFRCMRWWRVGGWASRNNGLATGGLLGGDAILSPPMRTTPTTNAVAAIGNMSSSSGTSDSGIYFEMTSTGTGQQVRCTFKASARM